MGLRNGITILSLLNLGWYFFWGLIVGGIASLITLSLIEVTFRYMPILNLLILVTGVFFAFTAFLLSIYGPPVRLNVSIRNVRQHEEIVVMIANEYSKAIRPLQIILEIKDSKGKRITRKCNKDFDFRARFKAEDFHNFFVTDTRLGSFRIINPYDRISYRIKYSDFAGKIKGKLSNRLSAEKSGKKLPEKTSAILKKVQGKTVRIYGGVEIPVSRPAWFWLFTCYPDSYVESSQDPNDHKEFLKAKVEVIKEKIEMRKEEQNKEYIELTIPVEKTPTPADRA